jgi:phosphohistidine phosphatase SixA
VAEHLRGTGHVPSLVLCSTSARTRETLARIAPAFDPVPTVLFERGLYGASRRSCSSACARCRRARPR